MVGVGLVLLFFHLAEVPVVAEVVAPVALLVLTTVSVRPAMAAVVVVLILLDQAEAEATAALVS